MVLKALDKGYKPIEILWPLVSIFNFNCNRQYSSPNCHSKSRHVGKHHRTRSKIFFEPFECFGPPRRSGGVGAGSNTTAARGKKHLAEAAGEGRVGRGRPQHGAHDEGHGRKTQGNFCVMPGRIPATRKKAKGPHFWAPHARQIEIGHRVHRHIFYYARIRKQMLLLTTREP